MVVEVGKDDLCMRTGCFVRETVFFCQLNIFTIVLLFLMSLEMNLMKNNGRRKASGLHVVIDVHA